LDAWDGYPAARERLYASFRRAGSEPSVSAGDSHAFWATNSADDAGTAVAVEFGTSSITSPSIGDEMPAVPSGEMSREASPEVVFCDQRAKGYVSSTSAPAQAVADYSAVSTVSEPRYTESRSVRFTVAAGAKGRKSAAG
ncbi:hypothetical protein OY671_007796, partial [Metschnikowia pulcherrima]